MTGDRGQRSDKRKSGKIVSYLCVLCVLCGSEPLFSENERIFSVKKDFSSSKKNICLSELISGESVAARDAEKLTLYCQIELRALETRFSAKDIEIYAWAAGVIPGKISGSHITVTYDASATNEQVKSAASMTKVRRGSRVQLVLKSEHMRVAREAVVLVDDTTAEILQ
jgi:hypothetical protein